MFQNLKESIILRFMNSNDKYKNTVWALVPAAGIGARMASDKPKQYMQIAGSTIIEHTLTALLNFDAISGVQLCLSPEDQYWVELNISHECLLPVVDGGAERADSVLAGLQALSEIAKPNDWVMVHDAARPCLSEQLLQHLIDTVGDHDVGGILAVPLADTIKYAINDEQITIEKTVDRKHLWAAQTPQMFRYSLLVECLQKALEKGCEITDEASALEIAGYRPMIVPSSRSNIKVTYPEDVGWVEYFLMTN